VSKKGGDLGGGKGSERSGIPGVNVGVGKVDRGGGRERSGGGWVVQNWGEWEG